MRTGKYLVLFVTLTMVSTALFPLGSVLSSSQVSEIPAVSGSHSLNGPGVGLPGNLIYSVPVVIFNNKSISTGSQYDQEITVNSSLFARYEAPNLQNVEWLTSGGQVIPSWIESNDSSSSSGTMYWLKIPVAIGAKSDLIVYLGFVPISTDLFSQTGNEGVSPVLTQPYGQYDNGAIVFPVYFNGNTPLSDFSVNTGINVSKVNMTMPDNTSDNVLFFSGQTGKRAGGWVYNGSSLGKGNFMLEAMLATSDQNTIVMDMQDTNQVGSPSINATGVGTAYNGSSTRLSAIFVEYGSWGLSVVSSNAPYPGTSNWVYLGEHTSGGNNVVSSGNSPGQISVSGAYPANPVGVASILYMGSYWADKNDVPMNEYIDYVRVSYAPPGGVMPSYVVNMTPTLTVDESGLTSGSTWYLNVSGHNYSSVDSAITAPVSFRVVNATFYAAGYNAFPARLSFNITDPNTAFSVRFSRFSLISSAYVKSTVYLSNDSVSPGSPAFAGKGNGTDSLVFARNNGYLYATDPSMNRIAYFTRTGQIMGNISLSGVPGAMVYDPANSMIYVAEPYNSSVVIVNTLNESVAGTIPTGKHPASLSLDSADNTVYVANEFSDSITLINGNTGAIMNTYPVSLKNPQDIVYDPFNSHTYIIGANLTFIGVINATGVQGVINLTFGYTTFPYAVIGTSRSTLYVSAWLKSGEISGFVEINTTLNTQAGFLFQMSYNGEKYGFNPFYDQFDGRMYVSSPRCADLQVIGSGQYTTAILNTTYSNPYPDSMAVSTAGSYLYFPETNTNSIAVIDMTQNVVTFTNPYYITNTTWSVTLSGITKMEKTADIQFYVGNGTYNYTAKEVGGQSVYSQTQNGSLSLYGYSATVSVYLTTIVQPYETLDIYEVGLSFGHEWKVRFGNMVKTGIVLDTSLRNEAFGIQLTLPAYNSFSYAISSESYTIVTRDVFFNQEFPHGYNTSDYISYGRVLNGTGTMLPTGGQQLYVVFFLPNFYTVTFHETGLDPGTFWDVTVGNTTASSTSGSISLSLPNGIYSYRIGTTGTTSPAYRSTSQLYGYSATPEKGSFDFSNSNKSFNVTFAHLSSFHILNVTFTGFPTDYIYGITIGNRSEYALGDLYNGSNPQNSIDFMVTAGLYTLNLSGIPANRNGLEPGRSYDQITVTVGSTGKSVLYRYSPSPGTYMARIVISGTRAGMDLPIDLFGTSPGGTRTMDIIQGGSRNITLALANGTYTIKYRSVSSTAYYYSEQLYWKLLYLTDQNVHFDRQGYMQAQGSIGIEMHYLPDYYLSPHTFTVSGANTSVSLHYRKEYNVTFNFIGPHSQVETVIGNHTYYVNGASNSVSIFTTNGSYGYSVIVSPPTSLPAGASRQLMVTPTGGNLSVNGRNVIVNVTTQLAYRLYVNGKLPPDLHSANVTVGGKRILVGSTPVIIALPNGVYHYSIVVPGGFSSNVQNGTLTISGHEAYLNFTVNAMPFSHTLSVYSGLYVIPLLLGIIAAAVVIIPLAVLGGRKE